MIPHTGTGPAYFPHPAAHDNRKRNAGGTLTIDKPKGSHDDEPNLTATAAQSTPGLWTRNVFQSEFRV